MKQMLVRVKTCQVCDNQERHALKNLDSVEPKRFKIKKVILICHCSLDFKLRLIDQKKLLVHFGKWEGNKKKFKKKTPQKTKKRTHKKRKTLRPHQ